MKKSPPPSSPVFCFPVFVGRLTLGIRGIDLYSVHGELINYFPDPKDIMAVPGVAQFHPRKDCIVGGTASGKVVPYGLPESAD
jgi:hypothetical protein